MSEDATDQPTDSSAEQPALQAVPVIPGDQPAPQQGSEEGQQNDSITEPGKLLRIASMVRELLEETRGAPLDERGRTRLRQIYERQLDGSIATLADGIAMAREILGQRAEDSTN